VLKMKSAKIKKSAVHNSNPKNTTQGLSLETASKLSKEIPNEGNCFTNFFKK